MTGPDDAALARAVREHVEHYQELLGERPADPEELESWQMFLALTEEMLAVAVRRAVAAGLTIELRRTGDAERT